jgi:hypothetical protein
MWSCVNDPIGYPDGDTTYVYTTNPSGSGNHVLGFSGGYSNITSVSMHIVAASNGGSGTATMSFYNNGQIAGQGASKTINSGSGYTEYVSGVFYTSISDISNLTMQVALTGSVKYTAIWLDLTYGPAGTTPNPDLEKFMKSTGGSDYNWGNGWIGGSCTSGACAGGTGTTSLTVSLNQTSPSRNGDTSATKVVASAPAGSGTASALEWVRMDHNKVTIPNATSITGDWWVYVSNASSNNPRTLEFDMLWGNGTVTAMWGTHCDFGKGWYLDAQDGTEWVPAVNAQTGQIIPCNLAPGQWHHVRWQVHQDPNAKDASGYIVGRIFYDYLTIDDTTTYILTGKSKTRGYKSNEQGWNTLGIQAQQDLNVSSTGSVSVTEYVDAMSFTYW